MITVSQAKKLRHGQYVWLLDYFDSDGRPAHARVTGAVKLWKTRPNDFEVPIKRGMWDSGYLTPSTASRFSLTEPKSRNPKKLLGKRR